MSSSSADAERRPAGRASRYRRSLVVLLVLALVLPTVASASSGQQTDGRAVGPDVPTVVTAPASSTPTSSGPAASVPASVSAADLGMLEADDGQLDPGDLIGDQAPLLPPCDVPPCEPVRVVSEAHGGYLPLDPVELFDGPIGSPGGPATAIDVGLDGVVEIEPDQIGALALQVQASEATAATGVKIWAAGTPAPTSPTLVVDADQRASTTVLVPTGAGEVSITNAVGTLDLHVDLVGWFPVDGGFEPVAPASVVAGAAIGSDATLDVPVLGVAGVPATGVGAVAVVLAAGETSADTALTAWPTGQPRPAVTSLRATRDDRRSALAVVGIGAGGSVSIHNATGSTEVTATVVGWIPDDATYHALVGERLLDTSAGPVPIDVVDVWATAADGVPDDAACSADLADECEEDALASVVALQVTALAADRPAELTVWPAGWTKPPSPTMVFDRRRATTSLVLVPVGDEGRVSIDPGRSRTHLQVDIVGWIDQPKQAATLEIPASTHTPTEAQILDVVERHEPEPDGELVGHVVTLAADVGPLAVGDQLAIGETALTPDGVLGEVVEVYPSTGGEWTAVTELGVLQDAFPQGEVVVDLSQVEPVLDVTDGVATLTFAEGGRSVQEPSRTPRDGALEITFSVDQDDAPDDDPACEVDGGLQLDYGPFIDFEFGVKWRWFKAPEVTALATVGVFADMVLDQIAIECGWDQDIMSAKVSFGAVPVVVFFDLSVALDLAAGLTGLDISAYADAFVTMGVRRNRLVVEPGSTFDANFADTLQARDLTAYLMVDTWLQLSVTLYKVIGPQVSFGPFVETFVTTDQDEPWFGVDLGLAGKVDLTIDLWFAEWTKTLYEAEVPLADWIGLDPCGDFGPGVGGTPCRTEQPTTRADQQPTDRRLAPRVRVFSSGEPFPSYHRIDTDFLPPARAGEVYGPFTLERPEVPGGELFSSLLADPTWHLAPAVAAAPVGPGETAGLPPGVSLDPATGVLSGTVDPAALGSPKVYRPTIELWYGPPPAVGPGVDENPTDGTYDDPRVGPDADGGGFPLCDEPIDPGRLSCNRWYGPGGETATDPAPDSARLAEPVNIWPEALILTDRIGPITVGVPVDIPLEAAGVPSWAWEVTQGALPPGLSLSADGHITGTVGADALTTDGCYCLTIKVTDAQGSPADPRSDERYYEIAVVPPLMERVSVDEGGQASESGWSDQPDVSADGDRVVFVSDATDLHPDDTSADPDVYVKDRSSGELILVDVPDSCWDVRDPVISGDGTTVAYVRSGPCTTLSEEVVVVDLATMTEWIPTETAACVPAHLCDDAGWGTWPDEVREVQGAPDLDHTGSNVVFAAQTVAPDPVVFAVDRDAGEAALLTIESTAWGDPDAATLLEGRPGQPTIAADGNTVVFRFERSSDETVGFVYSRRSSTSWTSGPQPPQYDPIPYGTVVDPVRLANGGDAVVYRVDRPLEGPMVIVDDRWAGTQDYVFFDDLLDVGLAPSEITVTEDGRYLAYWVEQPGPDQVVVLDRSTGCRVVVGLRPDGRDPENPFSGSWDPTISADGSVVVFTSDATDLLPGGSEEPVDVFAYRIGERWQYACECDVP